MISKEKTLHRTTPLASPVRVLQFGEGNFMRGFIDWMIERMNRLADFDTAVIAITPRSHAASAEAINSQNGLFTVILRGVDNGKLVESTELIECVKGCLNPATEWERIVETACSPDLRFVFSNTTEAGIIYKPGEDTFPAQLAKLLTARCKAGLPGLIFLPCELIENNGDTLRDCILQYVESPQVVAYVQNACVFCNTLVDRIVSGFPREEKEAFEEKLGYSDCLMTCAEPFYFFAIEGADSIKAELPFAQARLSVILTHDLKPYRMRKVRFLNGAHTASVLAAHLAGFTDVDDMVNDPGFNASLRSLLFEEIAPTLQLPEAEKQAYAESVLERFANPYAHHRLLSIAMNSVSKWRVRILPTLLDFVKQFGTLPPHLTQSMVSLILFYRTNEINDSPEVKAFFATTPSVAAILAREDFWGIDLNTIPGFTHAVENGVSK